MTEPLTPADCDLRGLEWMPLYGARLLTSETWLRATPEARCAALTLWWASWHQVPAASLADDDLLLSQLAGYGVAGVKQWRRIRDQAMRGWIKCSDGRLYHPTVAALACEAWDRRVKERARKAAWRAGRNADGDGDKGDMSPGQERGPDAAVPADITGQDRTGQEVRKEEREEAPPSGPPAIAPPAASPNARGCRLPDDFEPDLGFASRLGLDSAAEWAKFRDYWAAQPGLKGRKTDWQATWRNWCRKAAEQRPRASGPSEKPRFRNGFVELLYDEAMARAPGDSDPFIDADPIPKDLLQ